LNLELDSFVKSIRPKKVIIIEPIDKTIGLSVETTAKIKIEDFVDEFADTKVLIKELT